jgi:hypothetical protein
MLKHNTVWFSKADLRRKITLPKNLTADLAEIAGIISADGCLVFRKRRHEARIEITGHPKEDVKYYDKFLTEKFQNIFNLKIPIKKAANHTYRVEIYSKAMTNFFKYGVGIPSGKKSRIIKIPRLIKKSQYITDFVRGVIDTDFYFVSDRNHPELGAWFASKNLVKDLQNYFTSLGMRPTTAFDSSYFDKRLNKHIIRHRIRIRKKADVKIWFEKIGTRRTKFYKRYLSLIGTLPSSRNGLVERY